MSIDLADILAHQFATPAPTAGDPPTRPGDGPWKPGGPSITEREYRAWLDSLTTDELVEHLRAASADVLARYGRAA